MLLRNLIIFSFLLLSGTLKASMADTGHYHRNSSVQWTWAMMSLDALEIEGNENILDLGSGDGKVTAYLSKKLPNGSIRGIDNSEDAIEFANKHFPQKDYPNLTFEIVDIHDLPYEETYDIVTAFLSLNWIVDVEKAILEIEKALKPGGKALIVVPNRISTVVREAWMSILNAEKWKPFMHLLEHQNNHSIQEYSKFIEDAGLVPVKMRSVKTSIIFSHKKEFEHWVLALKPRLREIPKHLLHQLIDARIDVVGTIYPQAGDKRIYAFPEKLEILVEKPLS